MYYENKTFPINEKLRRAALAEYAILKSGADKDYDNLTFLAAQLCDTPYAQISILGKQIVWFKSQYGSNFKDMPRENSLCQMVISKKEELQIYTAKEHPELLSNLDKFYDEKIKFYAAIPLLNSQGHAIAVFSVLDTRSRDLTTKQLKGLQALANQALNLFEFRKQNIKLINVQRILKQKYKELERFAGLVSHDIKSPLANIISLTELLKEENSENFNDETKQYLEFLVESSYSLRNYVDGILNFYRSDNVLASDFVNVDLHKILKGIVDLYKFSEDVHINYPDNVMLHNVNKAALTQIFMNLIGNALKYNKSKIRKVDISFHESDEYYYFEVKDNGTGIPKEDIPKIFEIFKTLEVKDRDGNHGSGIGLATVKKHIETMGGTINVESILGEGCTFKFKIRRN